MAVSECPALARCNPRPRLRYKGTSPSRVRWLFSRGCVSTLKKKRPCGPRVVRECARRVWWKFRLFPAVDSSGVCRLEGRTERCTSPAHTVHAMPCPAWPCALNSMCRSPGHAAPKLQKLKLYAYLKACNKTAMNGNIIRGRYTEYLHTSRYSCNVPFGAGTTYIEGTIYSHHHATCAITMCLRSMR